MREDAVSLIAGLFGERELAAITGGGGKTTLMFALARHLQKAARVIATTTTHLCPPGPGDTDKLILGEEARGELFAAPGEKSVTIAESEENGRLRGFAPKFIDELYAANAAPYILVEADGAKRLPFKAYEAHEPVIPRGATLHIVTIGAEPFLNPLTEANTFRLRLFTQRRGIKSGDRLSYEMIADILEDPNEYLKDANLNARRVLLVNKCDLAGGRRIEEIAPVLRGRLRSYDHLLFVSLRNGVVYGSA